MRLPGRADAMSVQEDHDFPHCLLLGPGSGDAAGSNRSDASTSRSRSGVASMTSNTSRRRRAGASGVGRADAPDHAGGEVLLDAVGRVGGDFRRNRALNCWPCVRSFTHSPDAVIHSPAAMVAA